MFKKLFVESVDFILYIDGNEEFIGSMPRARTKFNSASFKKKANNKEVTLKRRVNGGKLTDMKLSALDF